MAGAKKREEGPLAGAVPRLLSPAEPAQMQGMGLAGPSRGTRDSPQAVISGKRAGAAAGGGVGATGGQPAATVVSR